MVNETNLGEKKVEKKEDEHVERKKEGGGEMKKEQLVHLEQQRAKPEELWLLIRTGNSTVRVCISSMYFYLQASLQCVSYLEHISSLHLFPELAANS